MNRHILNHDVASPLLAKLTKDTLDYKIKWQRLPIDENVVLPKGCEVALTTAHKDYHFAAEISPDGTLCHFQHKNSLYFIWIANDIGMAVLSDGLYMMPAFVEQIIGLSKAIRVVTHDHDGILESIDEYLNA